MFNKEEFKLQRKKKKITQEALGKLIGKSSRTIVRWETGLSIPSEYFIRLIAEVLNISVTRISDLQEIGDLHPYYYGSLGKLDKITLDLSTKTETEKQKMLINLQNQTEMLLWEKKENKRDIHLFSSLLNSINFIIYRKDKNLKYTYVNQFFLSYFNILDRSIILGHKNNEIWNPKSSMKHLDDLERQVIKQKIGVHRENIPIASFVGPSKTGFVSLDPVLSEAGTVNGITGTIIDISGEDTAKEKYFYMESILDKIEHAIWIIKTKPYRHYIYVNNAIQDIFQIRKNEFYCNADRWMNFIYKEDKKRVLSEIKNRSNFLEYRIQLQDGNIRHIQHFIYNATIKDEELEFGVIRDCTQLKEATRKLEILDINIKAMSDGLAIRDIETDEYIYFNDSFEKILGVSNDIIKEKNLSAVLKEILIMPEYKIYEKQILADPFMNHESLKILRPDGEIKWIQITREEVNFLNRTSALLVVKDITERQKKDETLFLLQEFLNITPYSVWLEEIYPNGDYKFLFVSDSIKKIYGYPKSCFYENQNFWLTRLHPDDLKKELEFRKNASFPKKESKREYRIINSKGETRYIQEINKFMGPYAIGIELDITDSKKEEENISKLKKRNQFFEFLANSSSDALAVINVKTENYSFINSTYSKIYGYPADEFYNNGTAFLYNKCIHPDYVDGMKNLRKLKEKENYKFKIIKPDDEVRLLEGKFSIQKFDGESFYISIEKDITENFI
ncbi:MAG TPA: PAS domain-containing protein [Victivallales bacterium]|nr:PAS domain-containing protein [Victivallales bacterium]